MVVILEVHELGDVSLAFVSCRRLVDDIVVEVSVKGLKALFVTVEELSTGNRPCLNGSILLIHGCEKATFLSPNQVVFSHAHPKEVDSIPVKER